MENFATLLVPAMLAGVQPDTVVGYITVPDGALYRQTYEFAAWFRLFKLEPGNYDVKYARSGYAGCSDYIVAEIPGVVTDACLVSCFGGVQYGPDTTGQAEIGKQGTVTVSVDFGYPSEAATKRLTRLYGGQTSFEFTPLI